MGPIKDISRNQGTYTARQHLSKWVIQDILRNQGTEAARPPFRSASNIAHTRTLGRLWKLPVSYDVSQSGDPNDARGPTGVRIVQELPEKKILGRSHMQPHDTREVWSSNNSVEVISNTCPSWSHMELHTIPARSAVVITVWKLSENTCTSESHMIPERSAAVTIERKLPQNTF